MRFKLFAPLISLALLASVAAPLLGQDAPRQQDDAGVIEDFVTTRGAGFGERPKETKRPATASSSGAGNPRPRRETSKPSAPDVATSGKSSRKNPSASKGTPAQPQGGSETATKNNPKNNSKSNPKSNAGNPPAAPTEGVEVIDASDETSSIGLGYTILLADTGGANTVVDDSREFVAGDKIRIVLETNSDGFLYIFNAENDGAQPLMLYPHATLDAGGNGIAAHARDFFPADLRYAFEFDDNPATEHLYVIFSRQLLPDVPVSDELRKFCGANKANCYWKPTPEQWTRIKTAAAAGRVVESRNKELAKVENPLPTGSLSRGIKVTKEEPAPAVVRMNASADSDVLLTRIELVHK